MTNDHPTQSSDVEVIKDLATEREMASPSNFGLALGICLIIAALLGFGIYGLVGQKGSGNAITANNTLTPVRPTTVLQPPDAQAVVFPSIESKAHPVPGRLNGPVPSP